MNTESVIALVVSLATWAYLVVALLVPERL